MGGGSGGIVSCDYCMMWVVGLEESYPVTSGLLALANCVETMEMPLQRSFFTKRYLFIFVSNLSSIPVYFNNTSHDSLGHE